MLGIFAEEIPGGAEAQEQTRARGIGFRGGGLQAALLTELGYGEKNVEKGGGSDYGNRARVGEMPGDELIEIVEGAADADEKCDDKGLIAQGAEIAAGSGEIQEDGEESPGDSDPLDGDLEAEERGDRNGADPQHDGAEAGGLIGGEGNVKINCGDPLEDGDYGTHTVQDGIVVIKKRAIIPHGTVI